MELSTLSSKGQLTIPIELRRELELHAGDRLTCFLENDRIVVVPAKGSLKNLKGIVPKPEKPVSVEEMNAAILEEAAVRAKPS